MLKFWLHSDQQGMLLAEDNMKQECAGDPSSSPAATSNYLHSLWEATSLSHNFPTLALNFKALPGEPDEIFQMNRKVLTELNKLIHQN